MGFKNSTVIIFCLIAYSGLAQKGFQLPDNLDELQIPFKKIFNLIILPVDINGTALNFILDTGASKSIIFNLEGIDSLQVQEGKILKVSGYGNNEPFDAYFSEQNTIITNGYVNKDASFLIMADQRVELTEILGIQINGLIGSDFFINSIVEIDYVSQELTVLRHGSQKAIKLSRKPHINLSITDNKPFIPIRFQHQGSEMDTQVLVDTGNGDALWLWNLEGGFQMPLNGYRDRVGIGMNGDVEGLRSKLDQVNLGGNSLSRVTVSIPDNYSLTNKLSEGSPNNNGSIGGEILSRFNVHLDYRGKRLYLKPNRNYNDGFYYNMAGIELSRGENEVFAEIQNQDLEDVEGGYGMIRGQRTIRSYQTRVIKVVPKILVRYVRPDSPAAIAGVEVGDQIIKIDRIRQGNLTLENTASKFFKNPYKKIRLRIKRGDRQFKIQFIQRPIIE
jgi:hypothetical protein